MPGKAYTQKEMKLIVDYLTTLRAYNEIRGRKMWMDMSNAGILDRTWQSLKETFLKRILPDIHNPYYKLTVEQISSFRQEYDVEARNKNRLEIISANEDSNSTENYRAKANNPKAEDKESGEDHKQVDLTRSSTETLVLDNCYETAEEVRADLESPGDTKKPPQKSIRDFITYSEPLTPMLQELMDDFVTDDEEPQLQIVEPEVVSRTEDAEKRQSPKTDREPQSNDKAIIAVDEDDDDDDSKTNQNSKIKSLKLKKTQKGTWENKEPIIEVNSTTENNTNDELNNVSTGVNSCPQHKALNDESRGNNVSVVNGTNDTEPLPNNQEQLPNKSSEKRSSTESDILNFQEPHKKNKKEKSRKRSRSQSSSEHKKKMKSKSKSRESSASRERDTQTFDSHPQAAQIQKAIVEPLNTNDANIVTENESQMNVETSVVNADNTNEGTSQEAGPSNDNANPADINPCLQSVSLYAEQFSQSKYSDDEVIDSQDQSEVPKKVENEKENNQTNEKASESMKTSTNEESKHKSNEIDANKIDKVILLKSHSESESESLTTAKKTRLVNGGSKTVQKALANVFGFASGTRGSHKKTLKYGNSSRRYSNQHRRRSRNVSITLESGSSDDYTTESDSDSQHRDNDRRRHRKYVRPPSYDILNNPEGGGLFVVGRKKLYPLILRENGALHYACAKDNAVDDDSVSYWKEKYMEERKKLDEEKIRADELASLLRQAKDREMSTVPVRRSEPIRTISSDSKEQHNEQVASEKERKPEDMVRIKFTSNKEIELEGQWPHVNPVFEKMVAIFKSQDALEIKKPPETVSDNKDQPKIEEIDKDGGEQNENKDDSKMEKVVEPRGARRSASKDGSKMEKVVEPKGVRRSASNDGSKMEKVVEEKGPRKSAAKRKVSEENELISSGKSTPLLDTMLDPEVHEKVDKIESEIFKQIEQIEKTDQGDMEDTNVTKRKRGRPRKASASASSLSLEAATSEAKISVKSPEIVVTKAAESDTASASSKRASKAPKRFGSDTDLVVTIKKKRKSRNSVVATIPVDDPTVKYKLRPGYPLKTRHAKKTSRSNTVEQTPLTSDTECSHQSESTQGYQDSDVSPSKNKRKKTSGTGQLRKVKRKSSPYLADDDTCETNDSVLVNKSAIPNITLNSEAYRSESYQLLVPKQKNFSQLNKIEETPVPSVLNKHNFDNMTPLTVDVANEYYMPIDEVQQNVSKKASEDNSSIVSLPLSPELSVVENMSVSRDTISITPENHPTINELQLNNTREFVTDLNKYVIKDVDVSLPLMEQDCELHVLRKNKPRATSTVTESMLNKIQTVDGAEQSLSDSLDRKLRDLLLESAKKMQMCTQNMNDKENVMEVDASELNDKKTRSKKRCSTPRKKANIPPSKKPNVDTVLEEHTESCSIGGRKSCPPVINVVPSQDAPLQEAYLTLNETRNVTMNRGRKKDVIKVKILRPRDKSGSKERTKSSRISICTDSGINDTGTTTEMCISCEDSTELIHNHSETCLHQDECIGDSVEFIENATKSIISLDSYCFSGNSPMEEGKKGSDEFENTDLFCTNAQDATTLGDNAKLTVQDNNDDGATVYHTPPSNNSFNSLITDDLSDETPSQIPSKWYLLCEQETNFVDNECANSGGSNLRQIFPITCAVPNLSTITENSKDNDSKPPSSDNDGEIQSIFNL